MNESTWYKLLMGLFFACFAVLLVTGGSRLIGSSDPLILLQDDLPAEVCICSPQASSEQMNLLAFKEHEAKRSDRYTHLCEVISDMEHPALCRDSNGNVLAGCTYMRAVYQAFALGDGFA